MAIILALVALAGSTWALMKAIRMPRALEKKLKTLEAERDTTRRWEGAVRGNQKHPWTKMTAVTCGSWRNAFHESER